MMRIWRRANESLVIGDDITVTVLKVGSDFVRLAISSSSQSPSYWEETLFLQTEERVAELELSGSEN